MAPANIGSIQLNQQINKNILDQATTKARAAGELIVQRYDPQHRKALDWAHLLQPSHDPGPPPPGNPPPPPPPPLPTELGPFQAPNINFDNGVPVGGNMSLAIFQNGDYSFSGHFHDSGFPSYDVDAVWVVVSNSGKAFTFEVKGNMYGTLQSGSRNYDFAQNGNNTQIRDAWPDLCDGYHWRWSAYVNWDAKAAVDDVVSALKTAGTVIGAVVAVVAVL
jgi:hypothetical protein